MSLDVERGVPALPITSGMGDNYLPLIDETGTNRRVPERFVDEFLVEVANGGVASEAIADRVCAL